MFKRWRIGSLLGFPVEIAPSFLLLLGVVLVWMGGLAGVFVVGLAFGSVLLHELGHALVARHLDVRVSGIELNFFGGAAKMIELPRSANHEVAIAAAGPAVSLALAGLGFGIGAAAGSPMFVLIGWINLVIAGFNLLPALPMDGGRILRALLTRRMDFVSATDAAVKVARVAAIAFAVIGLAVPAFQLVLLAPILWIMGTHERVLARQIAHRYAYDAAGYSERPHGAPEVMPPRWGWGFHRDAPGPAPRRFVVLTRDGRFVVEVD